MKETVFGLLRDRSIELCGVLPLSDCHICRPYLLERAGIDEGTVFIFAVPYLIKTDGRTNLSAYAHSKDYHIFMRQLEHDLLCELRAGFPEHSFAMFSDHSPIDERHAAASAGLGVIGRNGLLITEMYSSYVFLGEIITSAKISAHSTEVGYCEGCGRCIAACPYSMKDGCLSALTQKKGALSEDEANMILKYGSVWGCDICAEVCPHTKTAMRSGTIYSPIPFFSQDRLTYLTYDRVHSMSDAEFADRAYSWRGRETIERNLLLFEGRKEKE